MGTAAKMLTKDKKEETKKEAQVEGAATEEKATETATEKKTTTKKTTTKKATATTDLIIKTTQEMETLTKAKALTLAKKMVEETNFNAFKLGGVLSAIQANDYWQGEKDNDGNEYDSFKSFMLGEYGLNYRKGMYLLGIYNSLVEAGIPWAKVKDVGWTKLKELAQVFVPGMDDDTVDEWVERAKSMSTINLIEYIKNIDSEGGGEDPGKKEGGDDSGKLTTITFKVHEDQKDTITQALDKAMKDNKTDASSVALDYICMEYLEGASGKKKPAKQKTLAELLKEAGAEKAFEAIGEIYQEYDITVVPAEEAGDE